MKILAFSPIKADGTSFYRGFGPLNHLERNFDIEITDASAHAEITWDVITKHDLIFFQRPSIYNELDAMTLAKRCNRPIVIDYDDDYLSIPATNPRSNLYRDPHRVQQIRRAIELADRIIVSTIAIAESIVENTGKNRDSIQVIPNAVDETVFDLSLLQDMPGRDTILWRGGDTHAADLAPYVDKLIAVYNDFPHLKWAFMGDVPKSFLDKVDTSRIRLYPFTDITEYFEWLFEIKPMLTIVPWEYNKFNKGKSNCSWIESTLAGAPTIFPRWSPEFVEGMIGYQDPESFYRSVTLALAREDARSIAYTTSFATLCRRFTLSSMNSVRLDLFNDVIEKNPLKGKLSVNHPKYSEEPAVYTDKQFFDYTWEKFFNQDYENYAKWHFDIAGWLLETFKPKSIVELGCGPGAMVERWCDLKVPQVAGFEINPHFQDYFVKRNPHYSHAFMLGDFLEADLSGVFDLCVSIEVFEHIPDEKLLPFIATMADHFRVLYFSSTPYRSSKAFDKQWGHCAIRTQQAWIALFEENGFQFIESPKKITGWDCLFISTRLNKDEEESVLESAQKLKSCTNAIK